MITNISKFYLTEITLYTIQFKQFDEYFNQKKFLIKWEFYNNLAILYFPILKAYKLEQVENLKLLIGNKILQTKRIASIHGKISC